GSSQTDSWEEFFVKTAEPFVSANNENVISTKSTVTAPFGPSFIWTSRIVNQKELIEDDIDAGFAKMLTKNPDALPLLVIDLPIANEDLRSTIRRFRIWRLVWQSRVV